MMVKTHYTFVFLEVTYEHDKARFSPLTYI